MQSERCTFLLALPSQLKQYRVPNEGGEKLIFFLVIAFECCEFFFFFFFFFLTVRECSLCSLIYFKWFKKNKKRTINDR